MTDPMWELNAMVIMALLVVQVVIWSWSIRNRRMLRARLWVGILLMFALMLNYASTHAVWSDAALLGLSVSQAVMATIAVMDWREMRDEKEQEKEQEKEKEKP